MKYLYNPPFLIKKVFKEYQWESTTDNVLLTFDDGPVPQVTEKILFELNKYNLKGIFFCVGDNIKKNPQLAVEIINEGHLIGNHTFHHKNLRNLTSEEMKNEILSFNYHLNEKLSYDVKYFRPPYGKIRFGLNKVLTEIKMKNIMWSLLTYDYKNDINLVKFAAGKYLRKNSIIVLHDSLKSQKIIIDAIKIIVDEVNKKDFKIGTPEICLK